MRTKTILHNPILKRKISRKIVFKYPRRLTNTKSPKMTASVQNLDLPRLNPDSPDLFFGLFHQMMSNLSITDEKLILHYLSRGIPQDILELTLNDEFNALSDKDKIAELKRLTISECEKNKEEPYVRAHKLKKRADETEVDFLRKLMIITRACSNEPELTKRCFLNNLSGNKYMIATKELKEGKNIKDVARNLQDYFPNKPDEINAIATRKNPNEDFDEMKSQIKQLTEKFDSLHSVIAESRDAPRSDFRDENPFSVRQGRVQFKEDYHGRYMRAQTPPFARDYRSSRENTPTRSERVFYRDQPHRYDNHYVNNDRERDYYRQQNRSSSYYNNDRNRNYERQSYWNSSYHNQANPDQSHYNYNQPRSSSNNRRSGNFNQNYDYTSNQNRQARYNQDARQDGICFYHHRYGTNAKKCNAPCRMSNTNQKN